jgi:acid phosphatase
MLLLCVIFKRYSMSEGCTAQGVNMKCYKIAYVIVSCIMMPLYTVKQTCGGEYCKRPQNLSIARDKVAAYYESHCYHDEVAQLVQRAIVHFSKKVASEDKLVVIFDIDETILSEYWYLKGIQFGYVPELDHAWIMKGEIPAIPEVKKFYDFLLRQGYHIVFITGRRYQEYEATLKNLKREGIVNFDQLITRSPEDEKLSIREYKQRKRLQLEKEGYTIVGCISDQRGDCEGCCVGYTMKIPNYVYTIT